MEEGPPLNLAIVGSRGFPNSQYPRLVREVDRIRQKLNVTTIISGGAKGADQLGERYAREHNLEIIKLLPDWRPNGIYDPGAGKKRNSEIVAQADYVLAFWDGKSTGTRDTIRKTQKTNKLLKIIYYSQNS